MLQKILVTALAAVVLSSAVWAQEPGAPAAGQSMPPDDQPGKGPLRHFSVAVGIGTTSGGPAPGLEAGMRGAGFADTMPSLFGSGPIAHPFTTSGFGSIGFPASFDVEYRFTRLLGLSFLAARSPMGETSGYHAPLQFLSVLYTVETVALSATATLGPLRLAIGPARHTAKTSLVQSGGGETWHGTKRTGYVAEVRLSTPGRWRFYLHLTAQYRHVGEVMVGPFTPERIGATEVRLLPRTAVRFDHWYIAVGPGFRF